MSAQGDQLSRGRRESEIMNVSSNRITRQIDRVPDTEAFADFPQFRTGGRKEMAQQPITAEPLCPALPAPAATPQPLEDPGQLRGDRGISLANEPAGVEVTQES
jgi:hypothetical protein